MERLDALRVLRFIRSEIVRALAPAYLWGMFIVAMARCRLTMNADTQALVLGRVADDPKKLQKYSKMPRERISNNFCMYVGQSRPILAELGADLGLAWPTLVELGPLFAEFGGIWRIELPSDLGMASTYLAKFCQGWLKLARSWLTWATLGENWGKIGPDACRLWSRLAA